MSLCGKPSTASSTASPVCCHILFLISIVLKTGPDSATKKKKCFKNLTTGLFTILPPFEIGNDCVTKWRVQEKSSAACATWRKAVGVWAAKQATYICHGRQLYLKELTDKPGLFRLQTLGPDRWGFVGFFFSTEWNKVSLQGKQTTLFFFTDNKIQSFKKNTNFRYSYLLPRAWQLPRQLFWWIQRLRWQRWIWYYIIKSIIAGKSMEVTLSSSWRTQDCGLWNVQIAKLRQGNWYASIIPECG